MALGLLFFAVFFVLFNVSLTYTTAARGTLALSTLPLLTMVVATALGVEPLTARKTAGVLIAMGGVAVALTTGIAHAPPGAWRGDLVMVGGALCMALYSVWSRPFIRQSVRSPSRRSGWAPGQPPSRSSPGGRVASRPRAHSVRHSGRPSRTWASSAPR